MLGSSALPGTGPTQAEFEEPVLRNGFMNFDDCEWVPLGGRVPRVRSLFDMIIFVDRSSIVRFLVTRVALVSSRPRAGLLSFNKTAAQGS